MCVANESFAQPSAPHAVPPLLNMVVVVLLFKFSSSQKMGGSSPEEKWEELVEEMEKKGRKQLVSMYRSICTGFSYFSPTLVVVAALSIPDNG